MTEHRAPYLEPGEPRQPMLRWARDSAEQIWEALVDRLGEIGG